MKVSQAVLDNLARARAIRSANAQAKKAGSTPPPVPPKMVLHPTTPKPSKFSTVYGHCTVKSCGRAFTYQVEIGGQLLNACPSCRGKGKKAA